MYILTGNSSSTFALCEAVLLFLPLFRSPLEFGRPFLPPAGAAAADRSRFEVRFLTFTSDCCRDLAWSISTMARSATIKSSVTVVVIVGRE